MADGESPNTTDVRKAVRERLEELENQLQQIQPGPAFENILREYVNLVYVATIKDFGSAVANSEDGKNQAREYILDSIPLFKDDAVNERHEQIIDSMLDALTTNRAIAENDPTTHETFFDAEPVMMFNGQFAHEEVDIKINGGGIALVFRRTYKNQVTYQGPLGFNWDHSYNLWLRISDETIFRSTGTLREDAYNRHPKFGEAGFNYWVPPDGQNGVIFENGTSFIWRAPNGSRYFYRKHPSLTFLHRIDRIEDKHGNYLDFSYQDDNLHQIEINHPERILEFQQYDEQGRICAIRDYSGRQWQYFYDDFGDLSAVATPGTDRYPEGLTVCYEYTSALYSRELQHNLTRIIDSLGQMYLENEYGADPGRLNFNRVVRQRQGGGERFFEYEDVIEEFDFDYSDEKRPAHQTTMVERNGQPIHYIFNKFGNLLLREESILLGGLPRNLVWRFRYNRDGQLIGMLSPEGVIIQYLYGREYFARQLGLDPEADVSSNEALTFVERQAFGRLLAVVRRGKYYDFAELNLSQGVWGDIFPDILGGLDADDIVIKFVYERKYGQLRTVSDPRFTQSADPKHPESPAYEKTLTEFAYRGPPGDPTLLLDRIIRPTPKLPNGTESDPIIDQFTAYDDRGRLQQYIDPSGVITNYSYYGLGDGKLEGHLHHIVVDPDGLAVTTEYGVDELGRLEEVKLPRAADAPPGHFVTKIKYNELDQVVKVTSSPPFNFEVRRFYDRNGNLERVERDAKNEDGTDVAGAPEVQTFEYDEDFNLIQMTLGGEDLSAHLVTKYCYDGAGDRVLTIQPKGNEVRTVYNERLLPVAQTIGAGSLDAATTRFEYDGDGRISRVQSPRDHSISYTYDVFGRIIAVEDALGNVAHYTYDKTGNLILERVFERRADNSFVLLARSEFEYDELGRIIRSGVNRFDDPLPATDLKEDFLASPGPGELLTTQFFHDFNDRTFKTLDPLLREYQLEYDVLYRVSREIDPLGNKIENHYDTHNNLLRRDVRDLVLDPISGDMIGERIFSSSATYDELDRMVTSTDSLGNTTQYTYDSRSNLTQTVDPLGNIRIAEYDIYGRLVKEISQRTDTGIGGGNLLNPAKIHYEYDLNSNLVAITDALGRVTSQTYDALDRHRETIYPDGTIRSFLYDRDGNLIRTTDNNGLQRLYTIDPLGRVIRVEVDRSKLDPAILVEGANFEDYKYDALGRLLLAENDFAKCDIQFNSLGWPLKERLSFTTPEAPFVEPLDIFRTFDISGALTELIYPDGRKLRYHRDGLKRVNRVENQAIGVSYPGHPATLDLHDIATFEYAGRQRVKCISGNGTATNYHHDGAGRIIEISHTAGLNPLLTIQQLYDAVGNLRFRNDLTAVGRMAEIFGYDSFYRLVEIQESTDRPIFDPVPFAPTTTPLSDPIPNRQVDIDLEIGPMELGSGRKVFDYDLSGNRMSEDLSDGGSLTYTVNNLDQYTSRNGTNFSFDLNGNMSRDSDHEYRYDSLNRLVNVLDPMTGDSEVRFFHDAFGRRVLELRNGVVTHLVFNGPILIAEYRNGVLFAQYVNDPGLDRPLQVAAEGNEHWYHSDLVGSTRMLTDRVGIVSATYRYSPFGELDMPVGEVPYNPLLYTSRRLDKELESYNFFTRQYKPQLGRFFQRDPIGMSDGTNLYAYVGNNPLIFVDPFGTERDESSSGSTSSRTEKIVFGGRHGVKGIAQSQFPPGTEGTYRLWSGKGTQRVAQNLAAVEGGWVLGPPIAEAVEAERLFNAAMARSGGQRLPDPVMRSIWDPPSQKYAILTGLAEKPFTAELNNPSPNSSWVSVERPALIGFGAVFTGGLMKTSGLLTIYSASQTDNLGVQIIGTLGGGAELTGGTLYLSGVAGGVAGIDTVWLQRSGSMLGRFGGGIGTVVVSGYYLIGDIKRGDIENGVGDAGATATGVLVLVGATSAAAVTGVGVAAYEGTRLIDEPLGISDDLSDRGIRVENLWNDKIGGPEWLSYGMGFAGSTPIAGIGVEGISWGVYGVKEGAKGVWSGLKWSYNKIKFW
jgi:RHS repeat-associated protein